ncbi:MAG TPA: hypothetical protein VJ987_06065 [Anaerolineales bacterium]|nr:hypothetical protein [Anaerolineales bacterium]
MTKNARSFGIRVVLGVLLVGVFYWAVYSIWPLLGIDWHETFYPALHKVLSGKNPYDVPTFRNAPWIILLLMPFGMLSEDAGGVLYFMASLAGYAWVAYRLKARPIAFVAFLFSPPVIYGLRMLNVDIFVLIGFVLPAPIGLFFVLIKPQMGIAMVLYWLAEAWREGGVKSVVRTFSPVGISIILSFVIFGNWIAGRQSDLLGSFWNASLWPWALPIGLVLVALSIRDRRSDFGMAASPFLSPYLAYHSWASVLAGLLKYDFQLVVAVIGMWIAGVINAFNL